MLFIDVSHPSSILSLQNSDDETSYNLMGFYFCGVGPKHSYGMTYLRPSGSDTHVISYTRDMYEDGNVSSSYQTMRIINTEEATLLYPEYNSEDPSSVQLFMQNFPNVGLPPGVESSIMLGEENE